MEHVFFTFDILLPEVPEIYHLKRPYFIPLGVRLFILDLRIRLKGLRPPPLPPYDAAEV